jgi:hypothetical protein
MKQITDDTRLWACFVNGETDRPGPLVDGGSSRFCQTCAVSLTDNPDDLDATYVAAERELDAFAKRMGRRLVFSKRAGVQATTWGMVKNAAEAAWWPNNTASALPATATLKSRLSFLIRAALVLVLCGQILRLLAAVYHLVAAIYASDG